MKKVVTILFLLVLSTAKLFSQQSSALIGRDKLIQDIRQLTNILETAHPDPYISGGGKIAFYRRINKIMNSIPARGLNSTDFGNLLFPLFISIGDGHTKINRIFSQKTMASKIIPIIFRAVENELYVAAVYKEEHKYLLGAKLVAIQGIPYNELITRIYRLQTVENAYYAMKWLCRFINDKRYYDDLLPEWKERANIKIKIKLPSGKIDEVLLATQENLLNPIQPPTKITLPSVEKSSIVYGFLDEKKKTALLRVTRMDDYKELFEGMIKRNGSLGADKDVAKESYKKYNLKEAPEKDEDIVAGLPSVVELYIKMLEEMKSAKSENLLIDVRNNTGGDDIMSWMLIYFLYGKSGMTTADQQGTQVVKYSDLLFSIKKGITLESINKDRAVPLEKNDYDFSGEVIIPETKEDMLSWMSYSKAMVKELEKEEHEKYYCPKNVIVICNEITYSAGFDMLRNLYYNGATIVGVPSSAAGNSFGDYIRWKLNNSGIEGTVSHKCDLAFPNDPEKGKLLPPHYPLTYKKLAGYGFDPNASIRYALEIIPKLK